MPMPVDAAPSRAAASAPTKTRDEVLEAVKSGAFPLADNRRDPLRNRSQPLCGSPLRSLTTLLILPLALTRIVSFIIVFTSTGCTAALAACLPARSCGRRCLLAIAMRGIRAGLFCLGYHYIRQTGRPSKDAKIVCANHVSFVETFYLTSLLTPCGMAEIETASIPMVASVLRALEFVLVDKSSPESRANAGKEMTAKLSEKNAPQFLVFAEGQTSDGRQVLAFKDGAFRLGHTVQPVAVRYRRSTYDPTNDPANMVWHFIRATFDLHHGMSVEFLDATSKQPDETPADFAGRVRSSIAESLKAPLSNHSHDDQRLQRRCRKLYKRPPDDLAWAMPETRTCRLLLGLNLDDCTDAARAYVARAEASQLEVKDVDAYRAALSLSEADAAALWALRSVGPLAYREFLVSSALGRCA